MRNRGGAQPPVARRISELTALGMMMNLIVLLRPVVQRWHLPWAVPELITAPVLGIAPAGGAYLVPRRVPVAAQN